MEFNKRIELFRKMLFKEYNRGDKIFEVDWQDEATELALEITLKNTVEITAGKITNYLENKFKEDTVTDFKALGLNISEVINPKLN
tara:strand:+ start:139818 stop:140075 length:258 start_codon:yes stop_codon:yes gene_type:complete